MLITITGDVYWLTLMRWKVAEAARLVRKTKKGHLHFFTEVDGDNEFRRWHSEIRVDVSADGKWMRK